MFVIGQSAIGTSELDSVTADRPKPQAYNLRGRGLTCTTVYCVAGSGCHRYLQLFVGGGQLLLTNIGFTLQEADCVIARTDLIGHMLGVWTTLQA